MCIGGKKCWVDREWQKGDSVVMVEDGFRELDRTSKGEYDDEEHYYPLFQQGNKAVMVVHSL